MGRFSGAPFHFMSRFHSFHQTLRRLAGLTALLAATAHADGLPPEVMKALKAAQIPASQVAVVVQPVEAAAPLVAHQASRAMNPASVMKLVTTYAALDLLGPAWTWTTGLWLDTAPGARRNTRTVLLSCWAWSCSDRVK